MATMSHTPAQRKAWHDGKRKPGEGEAAWLRRVIARKQPNFNAAHTPSWMKRRIVYQARG